MTAPVRILNGGSLADTLPVSLPGERIVCHECLIEGPVRADSLPEFIELRGQYLRQTYPEHAKDDYATTEAAEFHRISNLPASAEVELWFEDDLFCQVNLWFVCHLLTDGPPKSKISWVRPHDDLRFGFAGMPPDHLPRLRESARPIDPDHLAALANLWQAYREDNIDALMQQAQSFGDSWAMVRRAAEAHRDRVRHDAPRQLLREIIAVNPTASFGTVFREFSERAPIYGFGDLQVRRLYNEEIASGS